MTATCTPTQSAYSGVPCGPLPHTGFDPGLTVALALVLTVVGVAIRRAL